MPGTFGTMTYDHVNCSRFRGNTLRLIPHATFCPSPISLCTVQLARAILLISFLSRERGQESNMALLSLHRRTGASQFKRNVFIFSKRVQPKRILTYATDVSVALARATCSGQQDQLHVQFFSASPMVAQPY